MHNINLLLLSAMTVLPYSLAAPFCSLTPPANVAREAPSASPPALANDDVLTTGWYPGWLGTQFPPESISWSKYTALTFAFAVTTPDPSVISLDDISKATLPKFVAAAKNSGTKALLSIGGWTGSQYFSSATTDANRTTFVNAIVNLINTYGLDGIDFDWEYPNKQGVGCNEISGDDSTNYLALLTDLRKAAPNTTISVAAGLAPFMDQNGVPMTDVSGFADVLDYLAIMAYDIWGSWVTSAEVGPNAPLYDACAPAPGGSAASAVKAWTSAGFPANKLALGVAAYGHSFHVDTPDASAIANYPTFNKAEQPAGDKNDGVAGVDQCGAAVGPGGIFNFWGLIDGGFLNPDGTAASGITYKYDNCSQTPFVYNPTSEVMVSYDDATSFAAKGNFINDMGLKGFAMWHVAGDSKDILLDSISNAMEVEMVCS